MVNQAFKSGYRAPEAALTREFRKARVAIVATRWNVEVVDALILGAQACLADWGVQKKNIGLFHAPGAYEIPLVTQALLKAGPKNKAWDGVVTLGAVIRGDTPHFDFVAGQCARGLMDVQLKTGKPVGFGVLTVNTAEQAFERARADGTNKGYEAAAALLEMLRLTRALR